MCVWGTRNLVFVTAVCCLPAVETISSFLKMMMQPSTGSYAAEVSGRDDRSILHELVKRGRSQYLAIYCSKYAKDWALDVNRRDAFGKTALVGLEVARSGSLGSWARKWDAMVVSLGGAGDVTRGDVTWQDYAVSETPEEAKGLTTDKQEEARVKVGILLEGLGLRG